MCGAPLTALLKKGGGVRPIAVGEVIRRLASRLCCLAVRPSLPGVFIPYGQVGVGIPGGGGGGWRLLSTLLVITFTNMLLTLP